MSENGKDTTLAGEIIYLVLVLALIGFGIYTWVLEIQKNKAIIEMNERGIVVVDE